MVWHTVRVISLLSSLAMHSNVHTIPGRFLGYLLFWQVPFQTALARHLQSHKPLEWYLTNLGSSVYLAATASLATHVLQAAAKAAARFPQTRPHHASAAGYQPSPVFAASAFASVFGAMGANPGATTKTVGVWELDAQSGKEVFMLREMARDVKHLTSAEHLTAVAIVYSPLLRMNPLTNAASDKTVRCIVSLSC